MKCKIRDKETVEPVYPFLIRSIETGNIYINLPQDKGICVYSENSFALGGVGNIVDTSSFDWEVFTSELALSND